MSGEPLVFIIIVNWNGKAVTLDCLASLCKITYQNHHILVVDNASSDGSVEAIRTSFSTVEVLQMRDNLRFAGGNNAGIVHAMKNNADLVLLLNNDTTVAPGFLSHMVERITSDSSIGMVTPKIYYHSNPKHIWFAGARISMWTGTTRHVGIREIDLGQYDRSEETDYATGCCILTKRNVIEEVGMLDESYFMYAEDADWSIRVCRAGYSIIFEPQAQVWHKISVASGGHLSFFKMKNKFLSNLRFFGRYAAWYHWLVFPWMNVVVNGVAAVRFLAMTKIR